MKTVIFIFIGITTLFVSSSFATSKLSNWSQNTKSIVVMQCGIILKGNTDFLSKSTEKEDALIACCTKNILNKYKEEEYLDIKKDLFLVDVMSVIKNSLEICRNQNFP